jgi:hypothetical protein
MDIEALKEQWSEVEDRDGVRLSWNVFPSSRMVGDTIHFSRGSMNSYILGSLKARCPDWSSLHSFEGEAGHSITAV